MPSQYQLRYLCLSPYKLLPVSVWDSWPVSPGQEGLNALPNKILLGNSFNMKETEISNKYVLLPTLGFSSQQILPLDPTASRPTMKAGCSLLYPPRFLLETLVSPQVGFLTQQRRLAPVHLMLKDQTILLTTKHLRNYRFERHLTSLLPYLRLVLKLSSPQFER